MLHLRTINLKPAAKKLKAFPFNLPFVRKFQSLELRVPVTLLVGENGSGKSTFLEALAAAVGAVVIGGEDIARDKTLGHVRALAGQMQLSWSKRTRRGFFLRAEDFFNFTRRVNAMNDDLDALAADYDRRLTGYGKLLAKGSVLSQKRALAARYGADADARSHGEAFLGLFQSRFTPGGLYLLDEPDAALSPQRQLALLAMLKDMVAQDAQFIIATHAPILMACPGAAILSFDSAPVKPVAYADIEHVTLLKSFLSNPAAFTDRL